MSESLSIWQRSEKAYNFKDVNEICSFWSDLQKTRVLKERKEILNVLKEMWLSGDSPLHRIYSSWEELELNVGLGPDTRKMKTHPCPYCGVKQKIMKPIEGIFPYQICESCEQSFYVNKDATVRKLTEEEKMEIPKEWIQVVEDLQKKKTALVFRLE